jgi:hypothetical protein
MATVGYLEGTDPVVLTRLAAKGVGTLPLSNGVDTHGKYVVHLTLQDGVSIVVGYLHKVLPANGIRTTPRSVLSACLTNEIPVVLIVEKAFHDSARDRLGDVADRVRLVDPADLYEAILEVTS